MAARRGAWGGVHEAEEETTAVFDRDTWNLFVPRDFARSPLECRADPWKLQEPASIARGTGRRPSSHGLCSVGSLPFPGPKVLGSDGRESKRAVTLSPRLLRERVVGRFPF